MVTFFPNYSRWLYSLVKIVIKLCFLQQLFAFAYKQIKDNHTLESLSCNLLGLWCTEISLNLYFLGQKCTFKKEYFLPLISPQQLWILYSYFYHMTIVKMLNLTLKLPFIVQSCNWNFWKIDIMYICIYFIHIGQLHHLTKVANTNCSVMETFKKN